MEMLIGVCDAIKREVSEDKVCWLEYELVWEFLKSAVLPADQSADMQNTVSIIFGSGWSSCCRNV